MTADPAIKGDPRLVGVLRHSSWPAPEGAAIWRSNTFLLVLS